VFLIIYKLEKYMKKYLIGLSALLAMGAAFASGDTFMARPASYAVGGTVVGVDVGWGWSNGYFSNMDFTGGIGFNNRNEYNGAPDAGAYIGYKFHPTTNLLLGVELGYKFVGYSSADLKTGNEEIDRTLTVYQNVIDLLFTAHYYVYKGWNLFGKIGVAGTLQTDPAVNDLVDITTGTISNADAVTNFRLLPEYSVGMGYTWNQKLDLHLTYNHIGSGELGDSDMFLTTQSIMLGLSYTFPSGK
jgi:hypothetical protein